MQKRKCNGKILDTTQVFNSEIYNLNPFAYKGYYLDTETNWYYLKSRYYDASLCRFINADDQIAISEVSSELNLFAYCSDNPVNAVDENGNKLKWWHKVLIGIAVIAVVAIAVAVTGGGACAVLSVVIGGLKGAAIGALKGAISGAIIGGIIGGITTGSWEGA